MINPRRTWVHPVGNTLSIEGKVIKSSVVYYESDKDFVLNNLEFCVKALQDALIGDINEST